MNKLGMFMNFWESKWDADHRKYIKKAADLGFDVLEFQAQPLLEMTDREIHEIKKYADDCGIELTHNLGLDQRYDISSDDESIREGGVKYLTEIIKKVHLMGGKIISGVSYAGWGIPDIADISKERLTENSLKSMRILSKCAEESDVTFALEAVNRFEGVVLNTAADALRYVHEINSPNVQILLDTYHMNIEEFSIGDAIRSTKGHLAGLHVGENNRSVPGRGHLNWDEIFEALHDIDFQGRIVAEPFLMKEGEVGRDIYVWQNLVENTNEETLDNEARFMLEFERKMLKKWC